MGRKLCASGGWFWQEAPKRLVHSGPNHPGEAAYGQW